MCISKLVRVTAIVVFPIVLATLQGCAPAPKPVFDFDDGTTQGWKITAVSDDKGKAYSPFFALAHFEGAQYPDKFPMGDPPSDKKGSLLVEGGQISAWVQQSGFPDTAKYWEFTVYYTGLNANNSTAWQNLKGVKLSLGDNFGQSPGQITANVGVRATIGGKDSEIAELDAGGKPLFRPINHQSTGKWSHIDAKLNVPAKADVYQVWIRFRGDWEALYEGQLMIDQVAAVK